MMARLLAAILTRIDRPAASPQSQVAVWPNSAIAIWYGEGLAE
jgi:hypothetical protein